MKKIIFLLGVTLVFSCAEHHKKDLSAQEIVDKAIQVSGGKLYKKSDISFTFRDKDYHYNHVGKEPILRRVFVKDSFVVTDIRETDEFCRYINDSLVTVHDTLANAFSNSVNSVHYFAYLPYGLNDGAVEKEYMGEQQIKDIDYYMVKVTFKEEGGGDDYDDTYLYWFNKETFKPDYLAYKFHVNGGGVRFREAYNERYINGIRFVDYKNYTPEDKETSFYTIDSLYNEDNLKLLSTIELKNITVTTLY